MIKIAGLERIKSDGELQQELQQGGRFVLYQYCISLLVIAFKRSSKIMPSIMPAVRKFAYYYEN
jgi:hypothetical protein